MHSYIIESLGSLKAKYPRENKYNRNGSYVFGANIAGFSRVADAIIEQGCV